MVPRIQQRSNGIAAAQHGSQTVAEARRNRARPEGSWPPPNHLCPKDPDLHRFTSARRILASNSARSGMGDSLTPVCDGRTSLDAGIGRNVGVRL